MLFYKITAKFNSDDFIEEDERRFSPYKVYSMFESCMFERHLKTEREDKSVVFLSCVRARTITFGAVYGLKTEKIGQEVIKEDVMSYISESDLKLQDIEVTEITGHEIINMMCSADREDIINDRDELLEDLGMDCFFRAGGSGSPRQEEFLLEEIRDEEALLSDETAMLAKNYLVPEIKRIFEYVPEGAPGHPVHYVIEESDARYRRELRSLLLEALYRCGRIRNRRFAIAEISDDSLLYKSRVFQLFEQNKGGAVVIRYMGYEDVDGENAKGSDNITYLCEAALKYRQDVLTIFSLPTECEKLKKRIYDRMVNMTFIELRMDVIFDEDVTRYLEKKAEKAGLRADEKLLKHVTYGEGWHIHELNKVFDVWYDAKMKTEVYPQYSHTVSIKEKLRTERPKGSASDELDRMIGLHDAKAVIKKALNYYKLQKMYKDMGVAFERPAMHMVFTGNPGTAKTTVARLFSRIMKDNELLTEGRLCEVGRSDLVGKYVGHTAPLVKSKFREARGSVLFIDEAYSLVDDKEGLYGDEAINTIVQEMENNRDNMVCIFAGYPDKMEQFLSKNPGLRSRIAFHVHFDDYDPDELCEIAELMAASMGNTLTEDAKNRMREAFAVACRQPDFGNGRYVRNLIEQAKMEQANRLVQLETEDVTRDMLVRIEAEDIVVDENEKTERKAIGFL